MHLGQCGLPPARVRADTPSFALTGLLPPFVTRCAQEHETMHRQPSEKQDASNRKLASGQSSKASSFKSASAAGLGQPAADAHADLSISATQQPDQKTVQKTSSLKSSLSLRGQLKPSRFVRIATTALQQPLASQLSHPAYNSEQLRVNTCPYGHGSVDARPFPGRNSCIFPANAARVAHP